ncbi:SRPBCC domain-containing protein [Streptomyces sp. CB01881]|uniref:SRPBCC family protein n=1 Tax=Streptomyces sp. CB01881 TaxID=2078691 RepID=UPI000CDBDE76|nr:SRPBCC domain-containing protein [Streptomyces sp. CB01881]AUY52638.1 ATPase [Streptomyces sp. CB01881]TYC70357.1 SRPBCC domain-containing protein [Streptomyces sp. CB01881]
MAREFEVRREQDLPATPEQVWHAVATGAGNLGWLYTMEIEPHVGGKVSRGDGTVKVWEPPQHFAIRVAMDNGFSNTLTYLIDPVDGATSHLRMGIHWVHEGVWDETWDVKAHAAEKHVDFYQHGLAEYLRHFAGRPAVYVKAQRPETTADPADFAALRRRLGVPDDAAVGDRFTLHVPGPDGGPEEVAVDWLNADFVGLRGPDALYRFFNGSTWNWPVWLGHHLFAEDADEQQATKAWTAWLNDTQA